MPLRKMKQKKFQGIYEYYRASDPDKVTTAYYINVWDNGKARKINSHCLTADEAAVKLLQHKRQQKQSTRPQFERLTITQLADRFFDTRTTSNNQRDKRRFELHIEPTLGAMVAATVAKRDLVKLQKHLQTKKVPVSTAKDAKLKPLSNKSINVIVDLSSRLLQWAYDEELISNPLPKLKKLSVDNERQRIFTQEELELIFNSTEGETMIFLRLMYHTAQRPQSILKLKKKHIMNGSILIESIKHQTAHMVPISQTLNDIITPWIEDLQSEDYIVSRGKSPLIYDTLSKRIKRLFSKLFNADLDYQRDSKIWASMYSLRHTAITNIYANTSDIYAAQSIANHSSVQMTQRYAKQSDTLKRNAVEGL